MIKRSFKLATLFAVLCCAAGFAAQDTGGTPFGSTSRLHVKHIIGFGAVEKDAAGELSLQNEFLRFEKSGTPEAQIAVASIKSLFLGTEDKQVGGTPFALTRSAMPFGGGRVVGMFSHKKYDFVTIEYVDSNNALYGAIFQLDKGQGQILQKELAAAGARMTQVDGQASNSENPGNSNDK